MQPSCSKATRLALTTRVISGSNGRPPRSLNHATRTPLNERASGARKREGSSSIVSGSPGSGPAIVLRNSATSATVRAIGPLVDNGDHVPSSCGTRPGDGRNPTTLFQAAGLRSDPPVSLPSAIGTIPVVSDAAAPPLLPPTVFTRLYGLCVAPKTGLNVFEPAPNSGVFVLPSVIAPAARIRVTISASFVGMLSL